MKIISTLSKTFFSYIPSNSFLTKLHPITKILLVFSLSIIVFIFHEIFDILILLLFVLILIILLKVPLFTKAFKTFIIIFLFANLSIFIVWCFLPFYQGKGNVIFQTDYWLWPIRITDQQLLQAGRTSLRIITMFFLMLFFFISTSDRDLIHGLRSAKIPFSVCLVISLTFRGLSMFQHEYSIVKEAMMTRGVEFEHISILKKIKNFISIFIALIILMFKRTGEMSASIESRGIPIRSKNRTRYHYFPFKKKDYAILIGILLLFSFSLYLRLINSSIISLIIGIFV